MFSLTRDVQQNKTDIKELSDEVRDIRQELTRLTLMVERLAVELNHDRQNAQRDHEMQQLRLENILLRFERTLPPAPNTNDDNS